MKKLKRTSLIGPDAATALFKEISWVDSDSAVKGKTVGSTELETKRERTIHLSRSKEDNKH